LHVAQGPVTRNLTVEQNVQRLVAKGIAPDDISLRPFRRLLSSVRLRDPYSTQTILIGIGGYNAVSGILAVEEGLADAASFGRCYISNPDLVERLKFGYPLTPNDNATFYTHGAAGYTSYASYSYKQESYSPNPVASEHVPDSTTSAQVKKSVAIVGAGICGIVSATALDRVGGFHVRIFERRVFLVAVGRMMLCQHQNLDFQLLIPKQSIHRCSSRQPLFQ